MEKREINELEPYLEKWIGFTWLPQSITDYYESDIAHANLKLSQNKRDLWPIENFFLFFVFGIIHIIFPVGVREHESKKEH
jgi:hypothetical protein